MSNIDRYSSLDFSGLEELLEYGITRGDNNSKSKLSPKDRERTIFKSIVKSLDDHEVRVLYDEIMTKHKDDEDQAKRIDELVAFPMLHWRIAVAHDVHPSSIDEAFIENLLDKERIAYERESKRVNLPVSTQKDQEERIRFTKSFLDHVVEHKNIP